MSKNIKQTISFTVLYGGFKKGLEEGKDIPFFDKSGERTGTVKDCILRADHVEVLVQLLDGKVIKSRIF